MIRNPVLVAGASPAGSIDRRSPLPLYYQLKEILIEDLNAGVYPAGTVLPPEMSLVQSFNLSRATVRRAMQELEYEGYISRTPGRGTIVLREKTALNRGLSQLTSFTEDMNAHGYKPTSVILDFEMVPAPAHIAKLLNISADISTIHIKRLRCITELTVALQISYICMPNGITLTRAELDNTGSLYKLFEIKRVPLLEADKTIRAVAADGETARLLGVPLGSPLLELEGVVYTLNNHLLEYHKVITRSDVYKYSVHLSR